TRGGFTGTLTRLPRTQRLSDPAVLLQGVLGCYALLVAAVVAVKFVGDAAWPGWTELNYFMAGGVLIALGSAVAWKQRDTGGGGPSAPRCVMSSPSRSPRLWLAVAAVLAAAVVLAACTGESTTAPDGSPSPATPAASPPAATATAVANPAPAPSPSPSPGAAPVAAGEIAAPGPAIDGDTRWGDLFEALTAAEQSCFRDEFGDALDETLARPIDGGDSAEWEARAFACLAPVTARAVFLEVLLAGMAEDDVEPDADERECLRATLAGADVAALVAAEREGDPALAEFTGAVLTCLPDVFLELMLAATGLDAADLDGDERACLLEALDGADWVALRTGGELASMTFTIDLFGCVPALYVVSAVGGDVTLSEAEASCLRAAFGDLDAAALIGAGETSDGRDAVEAAFSAPLLTCLPAMVLDLGFGAALGRDLDEAEASCLRESLAGLDWNVFGGGALDTEIAVRMARCVPDLLLLAMLDEAGAGPGDVSEDELACMREWVAGVDAGEQLAAVAAGGVIAAAELGVGFFACAPHLLVPGAGSLSFPGEDATPVAVGTSVTTVAVGTSVEAVLDAADFAAVFAFEAEQGTLYQIDVSPGTLSDPVVTLYDTDWRELDFNDDYGDSLGARIYWEATYSGTHYLEVWGYDSGSYTLGVVARD
ncbi:MAG: hypothetical protein OXE43_13755, partial [Chloroflexi bacterium]|nr:hypothetical protein [Chloroflexota bacterium]